MKKVKIMLMSLLLLGVVGGALAFKEKFSQDYCTTLPSIGAGGDLTCANLTCPIRQDNVTTTNIGQVLVVCTTLQDGGEVICPQGAAAKACGAAVQRLKSD